MTLKGSAHPLKRGTHGDWSAEITPERETAPGTEAAASGGGNRVSGGTGGGNWIVDASGGTETAAPETPTSGVTGWSGNAPLPAAVDGGGMFHTPGGNGNTIGEDIENNLPPDEIGTPDSLEEVFRGSMKALLLRNIGNYVVATFLIGTQGTVSWEGILYDVGNDYVAIYQTGRDQYIVSDLYSLKYVEFYDTRRRQMCDALLAQQTEPA